MKKLAISTILLATIVSLAGCGDSSKGQNLQPENTRLANENVRLTEEINRLTEEIDQLTEKNDQLAEKNDQLAEENDQLAEENAKLIKENADVSKENVRLTEENSHSKQEITSVNTSSNSQETVKQTKVVIPAEKEAIHVSVLHRNDLDRPVATYPTADRAGTNAIILNGNVKLVTFVVSGVTVERIEVIDLGSFKAENVTFDESENQYVFEYSYGNYGSKTFLVTTCNGKQYFFSAKF